MKTPIYFDNNATTPLDPRVKAVMDPWFGIPTNASSAHGWGRSAREALEKVRREVADLLGGKPEEIYFFSSGTEANAAVLRTLGVENDYRGEVVFSALEHPSVVEAVRRLEERGMKGRRVAEASPGLISAAAMEKAMTVQTRLVALMLAHNVTGALQPVAEVAREARQRGIPVLCDAVQAVGKIPVRVRHLGVAYLTLGAHKFRGPLGAAVLWKHPEAPLHPWLPGGGQERGIRASTENLPALVGLGEACRLAQLHLQAERDPLRHLQRLFEEGISALPGVKIRAASIQRLPTTSFVEFPRGEAEAWRRALDRVGIAVSTGSACHDGIAAPAGVRFSFGGQNTEEEVKTTLKVCQRLFEGRFQGS